MGTFFNSAFKRMTENPENSPIARFGQWFILKKQTGTTLSDVNKPWEGLTEDATNYVVSGALDQFNYFEIKDTEVKIGDVKIFFGPGSNILDVSGNSVVGGLNLFEVGDIIVETGHSLWDLHGAPGSMDSIGTAADYFSEYLDNSMKGYSEKTYRVIKPKEYQSNGVIMLLELHCRQA